MGLTGVESQFYLERTMLANVQKVKEVCTTLPIHQSDQEDCDSTFSNLRLTNAVNQILDIIICLIFMVFWCFYRFTYRKKIKFAKSKYPSPDYFAVQIENIPKDTSVKDLSDLFKDYRSIREISIGRNYFSLHDDLEELYRLERTMRQISLRLKDEYHFAGYSDPRCWTQ